jgi:hypothetical protein
MSQTMELKQPHLIQQILDNMGMKPNAKTKDKTVPSSTILRQDLDGKPFDEKRDYWPVIGKASLRSQLAPRLHTQSISARVSWQSQDSPTQT